MEHHIMEVIILLLVLIVAMVECIHPMVLHQGLMSCLASAMEVDVGDMEEGSVEGLAIIIMVVLGEDLDIIIIIIDSMMFLITIKN